MNPKRDLVAKMLLTTLSVPRNTFNLRNTFTRISNSKLFKDDATITPNYVAGVWYNHVSKYKKGDTTNKVGNKRYCFVLHGTSGNFTVANRKVCKSNILYRLGVEESIEEINEE